MVFNRTSCVKRFRRSGFTLAEYMVATSIGLLALGAALVLWAYASKTCAALLGYVDLSSTSKNALDHVSQQVRNAKMVQSCSQNKLVLLVAQATGTNCDTLTFAYDSTNLTLTQIRVTPANVQHRTTLLTGCTNFQFSIYQRTPLHNSFELYTNAWNTNTAKVVQMQWTCVRRLTGDQNTVEAQVSSKVVIRNQ